jgi:threonine synthase
MQYYPIHQPTVSVSLKDAVLKSISAADGLYMPAHIPSLPAAFIDSLRTLSLPDMATVVATAMMGDDVPENDLRRIVHQALSFPIPLKPLTNELHVLELFHGPTLAFKDVGARFMAGLFEYFLAGEQKEVTILVATSGDTGSAVADAFYNKAGIKVCILYPSGKVSGLQEKQLTTMGGNIHAVEVNGSFDDCQHLVKQAFADESLNARINLTSANSINFARLFPQSFYYFYAMAQLETWARPIYISVPSGNFGNLTAGLIAKKMGLPVHRFIAATNMNHCVPDYLQSGIFAPQPIQYTISNAMDVAKPSNFPRMLELYDKQHAAMQADIIGHWCTDAQTRIAMRQLYDAFGYIADPHGAIAFDGLQQHIPKDAVGIFLESAHPAKFPDAVSDVIGTDIVLPSALEGLMHKQKKAIPMDVSYTQLTTILSDM